MTAAGVDAATKRTNWISITQLIIQILVILASGIWVVTSVQTTTAVLGVQINALSNSISELRETIKLQGEQIKINAIDISNIRGRMEREKAR